MDNELEPSKTFVKVEIRARYGVIYFPTACWNRHVNNFGFFPINNLIV